MPNVIPFRGLLFNHKKISGDDVIAPPYDVITPQYKEALYDKSPYNIVRIDFGKELPEDTADNNRYSRARALLDQWTREEVLIRDLAPAFYAYEMDYTVLGRKKVLKGIFGLVKIVELGCGIFPHEMTHSKPKADRLDIMRYCKANLSPIYSIYNSSERLTSDILASVSDAPYLTARDADGATHRLFKISDPAKTGLISKELSDKSIFIADGHHRYEVALEYKRDMDLKTGRSDDEQRPWD